MMIGQQLGPYEVTARLGEGGMGVVYRARDTRLRRDVALKILPESVAFDAERVARFRREAQVLAALNHPGIAQIYGFEELTTSADLKVRPTEVVAPGAAPATVLAIAMELVEGPTLAEYIAANSRSSGGTRVGLGEQAPTPAEREGVGVRGKGVPVDEALALARQLAEALAAGIVHRDLKPANIKVRDDGTVKVLDFGLARVAGAAGASGAGGVDEAGRVDTDSPTITSPAALTAQGIILGTAAYMAPEQAKGRAVDKRADVWAFGCVLYELLTGRRAFDGEDISDTLAAVLRAEPDWSALPAGLPGPIRTLLAACLDKDPRTRVADMAAALFVLAHHARLQAPGDTMPAGPAGHGAAGWRRAMPWAAAGSVLLLFWGPDGLLLAPPVATGRPVTRFSIPLGENFSYGLAHLLAISPAGTHIAYAVSRSLWLRPLDQLDATRIQGQ